MSDSNPTPDPSRESPSRDSNTKDSTLRESEVGLRKSLPPPHGSGHGNGNNSHAHHSGHHKQVSSPKLMLAALGIVYGDIGTSPLYALQACFRHGSGITAEANNVLGLLSLFFWSLTLVVVVKYIMFITRADNHGEGGILALLSLAEPKDKKHLHTGKISALALAGLVGAALLYADGMLTPAISVMSAVEGITGIDPSRKATLAKFVVPISVLILGGLFLYQKKGTAKVGNLFGPIMIAWFGSLASFGLYWVIKNPAILSALSPHHAVWFMAHHGLKGFMVLGSVVLCVTGGEALYADMGHFGRKPVQWAWYGFVFPGLVLNYFGQGALMLSDPSKVDDSFYSLAPQSFRIPLIILATMATVIASQALISGAFSLTRQAIQLGYLPRLEILHTSSETEGQIYLPEINWMLMLSCMAMVIGFGSAEHMEAAYGIAVTGTMLITTVLFYRVASRWWGAGKALILCIAIGLVDLAFLGANVMKLAHGWGGWAPIIIAIGIFALMTSWKLGRDRVYKFMQSRSIPLDEFMKKIEEKKTQRVPGTAVFMTSSPKGTPPVLLHHFKHNQVLHEQVVLLSIITDDVPMVPRSERTRVDVLTEGFYRVTAHYGFMQVPRVTDILRTAEQAGLHTKSDKTSFFLGREKLIITKNQGLPLWRKYLFSFLTKNAHSATDFFRIPAERVVEMGMQLEL